MSVLKIRSSFQNQNANQLNVEALEDRMMLSSVEIFAAGATGQENLELLIDGEVVQTFYNVGGDASTRDFQKFTFHTDPAVTPGDIGIRFSNDKFDPARGIDRDLIVDRIVVNGVNVEAEDPSTFSTGVFADGGLTGPGFFETEILNVNGTLTFADPSPGGGSTGGGDRIEFDAVGTTGEELVNLVVDGEVVQSFFLFQSETTHTFQSDDPNVSLEDIRIEFVNDLFDASRGIDRNVQISEFRVIDGDTGAVQSARTSDANVLNSGVFIDGAVTDQLGAGGYLVSNGFVEISGGGGSTGAGDQIEFDAVGTTGEELVNLLVDGQVVQTFGLFQSETTFTFRSDDPNVSIEDIRLEFINDAFDASTGLDRNVSITEFRVIDGDTGAVQSASTSDANVLSSGIFVSGVGITSGLGAGGYLAGNGFVEISDGTGVGVDPGAVVTAIVPDPTFQVSDGALAFDAAIGPAGQIATRTIFNEIRLVDSDGIPVSSFGGDGLVDIEDLLNVNELGAQIGLGSTDLTISDLEFFDDGSILASGFIEEAGSFLTPATPVVARLNPDGTLDSSFQQGIVEGTLIDLPGNAGPENVFSVIDSSGGIILLGTNPTGASGAQNFVVSRLNPDGTIDTSFADSGNQLIPGASFPSSGVGFPAGELLGVDVSDNGDITFAVNFPGIVDGATAETFVVGRLLADGSLDQGFGDNGLFVRSVGGTASATFFELTPDGGSAIVLGGTVGASTLLVVSPDGVLTTETELPINTDVLNEGSTSGFPAFAVPVDLAVDSAGNLAVASLRVFPGPGSGGLPNIIQRILPSGELDTAFGLDGGAILEDASSGVVDLIFDSEDRLVVSGEDLVRFEFV